METNKIIDIVSLLFAVSKKIHLTEIDVNNLLLIFKEYGYSINLINNCLKLLIYELKIDDLLKLMKFLREVQKFKLNYTGNKLLPDFINKSDDLESFFFNVDILPDLEDILFYRIELNYTTNDIPINIEVKKIIETLDNKIIFDDNEITYKYKYIDSHTGINEEDFYGQKIILKQRFNMFSIVYDIHNNKIEDPYSIDLNNLNSMDFKNLKPKIKFDTTYFKYALRVFTYLRYGYFQKLPKFRHRQTKYLFNMEEDGYIEKEIIDGKIKYKLSDLYLPRYCRLIKESNKIYKDYLDETGRVRFKLNDIDEIKTYKFEDIDENKIYKFENIYRIGRKSYKYIISKSEYNQYKQTRKSSVIKESESSRLITISDLMKESKSIQSLTPLGIIMESDDVSSLESNDEF